MLDDRVLPALGALVVLLLGLAVAGVSAVVTSVLGVAAFVLAVALELRTAQDAGVEVGELPRPPAMRYLLIAFPFLFVVAAVGEEQLLAVVGAAVLTQAAYVRAWRRGRPAGA